MLLAEVFLQSETVSLFSSKDGQDSVSPGCRARAAGAGGVPHSTGVFSQSQRQGTATKPRAREVKSKDWGMWKPENRIPNDTQAGKLSSCSYGCSIYISGLLFPIHFKPFACSIHDFSPGLFRQDTQQAWWTMLQFKVAVILPLLLQL